MDRRTFVGALGAAGVASLLPSREQLMAQEKIDKIIASPFDMVVIDLASPGAVELDSLNFQPEADTIGRAVYATSVTPDSLTITDSTFTGFNSNGGYIYYTSTTEPGGAVRLEAGDLHVSGSTFDSNSSYAEGGAISVGTITGDSSIMRSTFSNNFTIALNNTGGAGLAVGTINPDATLTIAQSYFVGNGSTATRRTGFRGIGMHVTTVQGSLLIERLPGNVDGYHVSSQHLMFESV